MKVEVIYLDGTSEIHEGRVEVLRNCFRISRELEVKSGGLLTVENATNSDYIPFTSVKKLVTLNEAE